MQKHIVLFAKAPQPGFAKTRLIPALGEQGAAQLAKQLLQRTLTACAQASTDALQAWLTPGPTHHAWQTWQWPQHSFLQTQVEGDLGARMAHATEKGLAQADAVLLMGTDCVEISAELINSAFAMLHQHDACIFPTVDGGYALLGLRRFDAMLFNNIPWSTGAVAALTRQRLDRLAWSWCEGTLLHDVDEPADLAHLESLIIGTIDNESVSS